MQNYPKISIVTPTFNAAKTLKNCIESIVAQTYTNFEYWIIDGLSTDGTMAIVKEYAEKYPHIKYISEKDTGIYNAMNKGIKNSQGEWLYFLGADDRFNNENVLEDIFISPINSGVGVLVGNIIIDVAAHLHNYQYTKFDKFYFCEESIYHQAIFMRRTIFERVHGFDEGYKICADTKIEYDAFRLGFSSLFFDVVIANYSGTGISSNKRYIALMRKERIKILKYIFEKTAKEEKQFLIVGTTKFLREFWLTQVLTDGLPFLSIMKEVSQIDNRINENIRNNIFSLNFWLTKSSEVGAFTNIEKGSILIGIVQVFFLIFRERKFFYYIKNTLYWLKKRKYLSQ